MGRFEYSGDGVPTEAEAVARIAGEALGVVTEEGHAKVVMGPDGPQVIDLSAYALSPWRSSGTARPKSVEAFIDYVKRHTTPATTIWFEPLEGTIIAVLNDAEAGQGDAWRDLRAHLSLPVTPEWEHWARRDGVYGTQREFAEHIEEGLEEVRVPAGAEMLEIAQTFQATISGDFRSATRLNDGTIHMQWQEDVDARAGGAGQLDVPQEIVLGLSPFYGEAPYEVRARIRYRIQSAELKIGYKLDRPDVIIRDCLKDIADRLRAQLDAPVFAGTPAPPQAA